MTFYVFCLLNEEFVFLFLFNPFGSQELVQVQQDSRQCWKRLDGGRSCTPWGELCLAGLFCFWAVLSMWLHSWLLFRSFLAQRAFKARQTAEKTGLPCNKVLCLLQGKISAAQEDSNKITEAPRIPSWADESGNIQQWLWSFKMEAQMPRKQEHIKIIKDIQRGWGLAVYQPTKEALFSIC